MQVLDKENSGNKPAISQAWLGEWLRNEMDTIGEWLGTETDMDNTCLDITGTCSGQAGMTDRDYRENYGGARGSHIFFLNNLILVARKHYYRHAHDDHTASNIRLIIIIWICNDSVILPTRPM